MLGVLADILNMTQELFGLIQGKRSFIPNYLLTICIELFFFYKNGVTEYDYRHFNPR